MYCRIAAANIYLNIGESTELFQLVPPDQRIGAGLERLPSRAGELCNLLYDGDMEPLRAEVYLRLVNSTLNVDGIDVRITPRKERSWDRVERIDVEVAERLFEQLAQGLPLAATYGGGDAEIRIRFGR